MTTEFIWQLPTGGDGRYGAAAARRRGERLAADPAPFTAGVRDPRGTRFNYFDYLHQLARAADIAGFDGLQIRQDPHGDDAWIVAGYVARGTRRLRLIAEFDASWGSAVYAAKNAVSFQRAIGGRFAWQIGRGPAAAERRRNADVVDDADVNARIDEFLTVARGVQTTAPFSFQGRFFEVQEGGFRGPLAGNAVAPVYLDGDDDEALQLSARQADVHLLGAAPLDVLRPSIARLRTLAAEQGRTVVIGLRIDVVARETVEEALRDAARYWQQSGHAGGVPAGVAESGFWAGHATAQTGALGALVGSYAQIEEQLAQYAAAGVGSFLLAAVPHFEEAYRFGEYVLPGLRERLGEQLVADNQAAA